MTVYDPLSPPDPQIWESEDDSEARQWVLDYHRRAGTELPNELIHATIHVIVERQVLLGDETPVAATLERLKREGLNRHDAVHAIGSVLAGIMWELTRGTEFADDDPNVAYAEELEKLTAKSWLEEYSDE